MENTNDNFKVIDESKIPFIDEIQSKADIAFFVDLLETYLKDVPENLSELEMAVGSKDTANVQFYAHKLKGSLLTLGVQKLSDSCFELESAGKENQLDDKALNNFDSIRNDLQILITELEVLREKYNKLNN